jgi:Cu+-exporting ATPase
MRLYLNAVGIPVAALGFKNPIIAAAAMELSSLSVIVNPSATEKTEIFDGE